MLGARYTGVVYVDGKHFTHPNRLMGAADNNHNKVLRELRQNVCEAFTSDYISSYDIKFHVCDRKTKQVETINY